MHCLLENFTNTYSRHKQKSQIALKFKHFINL